MRRTLGPWRALLVMVAVLVGCSSDRAPVTVADGFTAERIATGSDGPTQMIVGPDGRLWVAQLAGGENAGQGDPSPRRGHRAAAAPARR